MKHNFEQMKRWHDDWVQSGKNTQRLPPPNSHNANSFRPMTAELLDLRIPLDRILCPLKPQASHIEAAPGVNNPQSVTQNGDDFPPVPTRLVPSTVLHARHSPAVGTSGSFDLTTSGSVDDSDDDDFQVDMRTKTRTQRAENSRHTLAPCDEDLMLAIEIPDDLSDLEDPQVKGERSFIQEQVALPSVNSIRGDSFDTYNLSDLDVIPSISGGSAIDLCSEFEGDLEVIDLQDFDDSATSLSPKRSRCMRGQSPAQKRARVSRSNPPSITTSQNSPNPSVVDDAHGFYQEEVEPYYGAINSDHDDLLLIEDEDAFVMPQKDITEPKHIGVYSTFSINNFDSLSAEEQLARLAKEKACISDEICDLGFADEIANENRISLLKQDRATIIKEIDRLKGKTPLNVPSSADHLSNNA
ncbi:hypothetical protein H4S07_004228, partial [Coemansia furcata]